MTLDCWTIIGTSNHTERDFESAIEVRLTGSGHGSRSPNTYEETLALFSVDIIGFPKDSQPAKGRALEALLRPKTAATVLEGLSKEPNREGTLNTAGIEAAVTAPLSTDAPRATHSPQCRFGSNRFDG